MKRLKDAHPVPHLGQLGGAGEARRTGTDDGHPFGPPAGDRGNGEQVVLHLEIGYEPLELPDRHGGQLLAEDADLLALGLLRADPPADRREVVRFADFVDRAHVIFLQHQLDKRADVYADRAAGRAEGFFAFKAARGFHRRALDIESLRHLVEVVRPLHRILLKRELAGELHSLRRLQGIEACHALRTSPVSLQRCRRSSAVRSNSR